MNIAIENSFYQGFNLISEHFKPIKTVCIIFYVNYSFLHKTILNKTLLPISLKEIFKKNILF